MRKVKRYAGKTEEEWRDWGERFGKWMDKRGREFGEEMEDLGGRFGKHMEHRGGKWRNWWFGTFGFIGPLIGSVIGIIFLAIGIFVLHLINLLLGSSFVASVADFLFTNLHWLFAIFLFSGYNDYFSKRYPKHFWIISPITTGISITIAIWILIWTLNLINTVPKINAITSISNFLSVNLLGIFIVLIVLGYIIVIIKKLIIDLLGF